LIDGVLSKWRPVQAEMFPRENHVSAEKQKTKNKTISFFFFSIFFIDGLQVLNIFDLTFVD